MSCGFVGTNSSEKEGIVGKPLSPPMPLCCSLHTSQAWVWPREQKILQNVQRLRALHCNRSGFKDLHVQSLIQIRQAFSCVAHHFATPGGSLPVSCGFVGTNSSEKEGIVGKPLSPPMPLCCSLHTSHSGPSCGVLPLSQR